MISCRWSAVRQIKISFVATSKHWQTLHQHKNFQRELLLDCMENGYGLIKRIRKHCLLNLNYLAWLPSSWKKPSLGLRFHSDILNSKCRKIQKKLFILTNSCESFKFIHFTYRLSNKKWRFFPLLFMQRFVYWLYAVGWFSLFFSI